MVQNRHKHLRDGRGLRDFRDRNDGVAEFVDRAKPSQTKLLVTCCLPLAKRY